MCGCYIKFDVSYGIYVNVKLFLHTVLGFLANVTECESELWFLKWILSSRSRNDHWTLKQ